MFASPAPWPLHDSAGTRAHEAAALAATAPHALMARAGLAVARLALALAPQARSVTVLAGPGNNGGDGLIAAGHLQRQGLRVRVLHLADRARLPADAADALQQALAAGVTIVTELTNDLHGADLLIDALLGLGSTRAPQGALAQAIAAANASGRPLLAVDLPSGLDVQTGCRLGTAAIRADWTLSLLTLKPGLFTAEGRDAAGEVWFDDLQAGAAPAPTAWLGAHGAPPAPGFAPRRHAQHKGSFGDVVVVGGAAGMQGAAWLAARAALTAGAGRVYLSPLSPAIPLPTLPELMQRPEAWADEPARLRRSTVVCGCGGGDAVAAVLPPLLRHAGRLLLDADALNAIARDASLMELLAARGRRGDGTVLTPHPLEAARLQGTTAAAVQADRLGSAQALARRSGAVVLLKGSGTVIADAARAPWINASGNAALAAPGSGDVLAGWLGGLWAQQAEAAEVAWWAARAACWLHGHAADRHLARSPAACLPLRAGDLIDAMAQAAQLTR
ncbi:MAG: NAD(P)H-hydrate dehydratase [Proteobacteria bacterium]|nr:NAD(P)H-hydrate dehydratase [Pseudomonadota bacterium]